MWKKWVVLAFMFSILLGYFLGSGYTFNDITGNSYTDKLIYTNNSFLIIYFHPDCDYCHYEVEQIILNMDKFSMHQIIMIATATRKSIEEFTLNHYLTEFDNISVLIDTLDQFYEAFGPNSLPTSFIYNKDKNLVKRFEGEVSTEALLTFLNR